MPGLVVWSSSMIELDLLAQHAARLVHGIERDLRAGLGVAALLGGGPRHRRAHADLERRSLGAGASDEGRGGETCGEHP